MSGHIANAIKNHELVNDSTLHVVAVISNSARFHSRYRLFREFEQRMLATPNVKFYVVELAFGDHHHEVTSSDNPQHLQLRTSNELWHKEALINVGVRHLLPRDWSYVSWIDADVSFNKSGWALDTIKKLQTYDIVQPWSECLDLGPNDNTMQLFRSFCSLQAKGVQQQAKSTDPYPYGHTGYAVACTRRFWENIGGLPDFAILGSADHHLLWACVGKVDQSIHGKMSDSFRRRLHEWQANAMKVTNGFVGYVPGTLMHYWHGPKARRFYRERWSILIDHKFDPDKDLHRDEQGLLYVVNKPGLVNDIRNYMSARNEDSIDE